MIKPLDKSRAYFIFYPQKEPGSDTIAIVIILIRTITRKEPTAPGVIASVHIPHIVSYALGYPPWTSLIRIGLYKVHDFMGYQVKISRMIL